MDNFGIFKGRFKLFQVHSDSNSLVLIVLITRHSYSLILTCTHSYANSQISLLFWIIVGCFRSIQTVLGLYRFMLTHTHLYSFILTCTHSYSLLPILIFHINFGLFWDVLGQFRPFHFHSNYPHKHTKHYHTNTLTNTQAHTRHHKNTHTRKNNMNSLQ